MRPTSRTRGTAGKIIGGVFVSIDPIATLSTGELTLAETVSLIDMPAPGAGLRGIARIDKLHVDAAIGRFVGNKPLQLAKAPIAHRPSLLAAPLDALSDVGEVLHRQRISRLAGSDDLLCDDVVCISLKALQSA